MNLHQNATLLVWSPEMAQQIWARKLFKRSIAFAQAASDWEKSESNANGGSCRMKIGMLNKIYNTTVDGKWWQKDVFMAENVTVV